MLILAIGAGGQLSGELDQMSATSDHEIVAVTKDQCDVTDVAAIRQVVGSRSWDVMINCAAYTLVDKAETEVAATVALNATAPGVMAAVCKDAGVRMLHVSTDFVFDGTATEPMPEDAVPNPLSVYGRTKLDGENAVRAVSDDHLIVRTSWLYGQKGPNFVLTMLRLARERGALRVVADQYGSPTWTGHLAPALLRLLERGETGTFHLTNSGSTTWQGLAAAAVQRAGLDIPVEPITTAEYPTPAQRPAYSVLDNRRWRSLGEVPLPDWQIGVEAYVSTL